MQTIDVREACANLEALVEAAAHGEPFMITRNGKALVQVTSISDAVPAPRPRRVAGTLAGQFQIPDDFDTMYAEEIRAMFEGDGKL